MSSIQSLPNDLAVCRECAMQGNYDMGKLLLLLLLLLHLLLPILTMCLALTSHGLLRFHHPDRVKASALSVPFAPPPTLIPTICGVLLHDHTLSRYSKSIPTSSSPTIHARWAALKQDLRDELSVVKDLSVELSLFKANGNNSSSSSSRRRRGSGDYEDVGNGCVVDKDVWPAPEPVVVNQREGSQGRRRALNRKGSGTKLSGEFCCRGDVCTCFGGCCCYLICLFILIHSLSFLLPILYSRRRYSPYLGEKHLQYHHTQQVHHNHNH